MVSCDGVVRVAPHGNFEVDRSVKSINCGQLHDIYTSRCVGLGVRCARSGRPRTAGGSVNHKTGTSASRQFHPSCAPFLIDVLTDGNANLSSSRVWFLSQTDGDVAVELNFRLKGQSIWRDASSCRPENVFTIKESELGIE